MLLAIQLISCDNFCLKIFVIKIAGSLSMPAKEMYRIICNPAKENCEIKENVFVELSILVD